MNDDTPNYTIEWTPDCQGKWDYEGTMSNDDAKQWEAELLAAGWERHKGRTTIWRAPNGDLYRGPFYAWLVMRLMRYDEPKEERR